MISPEIAAKLALLAYDTNPRMAGFDINLFKASNITGFFAVKPGELVVVFCGTNEIKDWLTNLDVDKIAVKHGRVHQGFYEAFLSVWDLIESKIHNAHQNGDKITIVGHSLGGALAAQAVLYILRHHLIFSKIDIRLITFGQPRCWDSSMAKYMDAVLGGRYLRFVNVADPVPRVPSRLRSFKHAGKEVFFDCQGDETPATFKHHVNAFWQGLMTKPQNMLNALERHDMKLYLANVDKMGNPQLFGA